MKRLIAAAFCMLAVGAAFADTIDDAAAKKRGVPVEQIQLENQLAAAQARIKELEAQVAALQKQVTAAPSTRPATPKETISASLTADQSAKLEALRAKEIARVQADINDAHRQPGMAARATKLQDRIKDLRNQKTYLPALDHALVVGDIAYINDIRVLQVQNDSEALVEYRYFNGEQLLGPATIWLQGVDAKKWTDSSGVGLHQLVEIVGTKKYDSNSGPTTVLLAKAFGPVMP